MFYHPNYYKKLRKQYRDSIEALPRNGESLVLEEAPSDSSSKLQASVKQKKVPSSKRQAEESSKPQASSPKHKASSSKLI
jgi:hypothetical protein